MFGFFEKKAPVEKVKKYHRSINYAASIQDFDIKFIEVDLVMKDGRTFVTRIYGFMDQHMDNLYNSGSVSVSAPRITSATTMAQSWISNLCGVHTIVNDINNPENSIVGEIASARIDVTSGEVSFLKTYPVAAVVEVEIS